MRGMSGRSRDLVWLGAVTFVGGLAAMLPLAAPVRVLGGLSAALPFAVFLWSLTDSGAPWIVYYLRHTRPGDGPRVIYVGMTGPRADGPASVAERIAEHVEHDVEDRPWKRLIEPGNSTVARRCWTRRGALLSERRRIRALSAAAAFRLTPPLRNDVHNRRRVWPVLSVLWLAVESRIVPGACWHRTARWVPVDDMPADDDPDAEVVERAPVYVPDDDEVGFFEATAAQLRARAEHPSASTSGPTDDGVDAAFAALTAGWDAPTGFDVADVASAGGTCDMPADGSPDYVRGADLSPDVARSDTPTTAGDTDGQVDASGDPAETAQNGATGSPGGGSGIVGADEGASGSGERTGGGDTASKECKVAGCRLAVARRGMCVAHVREYEAEQRRKQRGKDKDGDQ